MYLRIGDSVTKLDAIINSPKTGPAVVVWWWGYIIISTKNNKRTAYCCFACLRASILLCKRVDRWPVSALSNPINPRATRPSTGPSDWVGGWLVSDVPHYRFARIFHPRWCDGLVLCSTRQGHHRPGVISRLNYFRPVTFIEC